MPGIGNPVGNEGRSVHCLSLVVIARRVSLAVAIQSPDSARDLEPVETAGRLRRPASETRHENLGRVFNWVCHSERSEECTGTFDSPESCEGRDGFFAALRMTGESEI